MMSSWTVMGLVMIWRLWIPCDFQHSFLLFFILILLAMRSSLYFFFFFFLFLICLEYLCSSTRLVSCLVVGRLRVKEKYIL